MVLFSLVTYDLAAPIAHITMPTILHFETKFVGLLHLSILADEIEYEEKISRQTPNSIYSSMKLYTFPGICIVPMGSPGQICISNVEF